MGSLHVHTPLYQKSQSIPSINSKNWLNCRYNRHKVGSTDMSPLLELLAFPGRTDAVSVLPDPPVEPTQGWYTDKTSLSQFLRTAGSTDTLSVLPINPAGLYKARGQHLGFQFISNRWPRPSLLPLLNPCGDLKNQPCKVILVHFFRFSTLRNIRSSPQVRRFAREASQGIHSKSPSIDLSM
jgi:hypothetical protein